MPTYTLKADFNLPLDAAIEDVWAFVRDREAQVRLHPQIDRMEVVVGQWGEPGSEFVITGRNKEGVPFTAQETLIDLNYPHSYTNRMHSPDITTETTVTFGIDNGRVSELRLSMRGKTRQLSLPEYLAIKANSRAMKADAGDDFLVSYSVIQRYLIEECGYGAHEDDSDDAPVPPGA